MQCPKCSGDLEEVRATGPLGHVLRGQRRRVCLNAACGWQGHIFTLASARRAERERERASRYAHGGGRVVRPLERGERSGRHWTPDQALPVGDRE